ncbi:MAG: methyltransferase domain-containing protein [Ferruginibacter sp.]
MKSRLTEPEKLDDLSLQGETLHKALQSLAWINRWFGNHRSVIKAIHAVYKKQERPLRIIDLGCGGGDLISAVARSLQQQQIEFSITGIDGNPDSLAYAQKQSAMFGNIDFIQADILSKNFSIQSCDILISSHFIYHFQEEKLASFLKNNESVVSTAIIFSELERNGLAWRLFKFSSFLLPISKMAKTDGLLAIQRSFTRKEWISILQKAGISGYRLQAVPLFRILLTIFPGKKI